ncbi:MAG TPA: 4Fe-4S dicluster domain-containing protein [Candidatus Acidoferrales bacterium]|nr:4Fe-4S dicluster domain-containing protein [Candidatus Acidoferrales bacterium]
MAKATLIDTTKCIGCRSCQVSCKQWNGLPGEKTAAPQAGLGLQNPRLLSGKTYVVITDTIVDDPKSSAGFKEVFAKRQCMHCDEPACASACPVTALHKTKEGPVVYDKSRCIGCRYCMWACPWGVPTAEWDSLNPSIRKCTHCADRLTAEVPKMRNGKELTPAEQYAWQQQNQIPLCVKACPAGALKHGEREELLAEAKERIRKNPGKYVDHIYGEHEAGGTGMLYLSPVPFEQLGFPKVQTEPLPALSAVALGAVPSAVVGVGAALGATYKVSKRREEVAKAEAARKHEEHAHPEFAPVPGNIFSTFNKVLLLLMALGGLSFLLRFALGLGRSTGLSDTWAWGLWIVFDFSWIAIAAGAFATAGIIYVLRRKDLYSIGRSAVLMGLLSYTFVMVTLLADLGLPWHFASLAMYAPKHSAMFEVSWCIAFYLSVLFLEFAPVPLDWFGLKNYREMWNRYSDWYVALAVAAFVWILSHNPMWTGLAAILFSLLAYWLQPKAGEKKEPIMLAIGAVTFSCMHQSSLGSLYLLMPDKLNHLWWSPILPICYLLSSIAAGTSLMVLVEMAIAKGYKRALRLNQLSAMGQISFWALLVYLVVRLGDVAMRGELAHINGWQGISFLAEVGLMGLLPLALLGVKKFRENGCILGNAALLVVLGVIWNRWNGVVYGMNLRGAMPQYGPLHYHPSVIEWGISVGMVAATIFLFKLGVANLPVLPKEDAKSAATGD